MLAALPAWPAPAAAVLTALGAGAETRLVGGAVRDTLLGLAVTDHDLATVHEPAEIMRRVKAAGAKAVPTGLDHGTVTAVWEGGRFEVTTLRRDVSTDGRRATVAFTRDWREDAARRDFTMNALYADPVSGELFDFNGGAADAAAGVVRFIGPPEARIAEDHLRILRFFRFHARFGRGAPDAAALAACVARANDLMALSRERVRDELLKLLAADDPLPTVALMVELGVLKPVLPEAADVPALGALLAAERTAAMASAPPALAASPLRRLAALLPADAALLEGVAHRLRLSTAERKRLATTADRGAPLPDGIETLGYWRGADSASDLWLLGGGPPAAVARLAGWTRPRRPVSGDDLIAAGMTPGPAVAARLRALEERWVASGFSIGREALLANTTSSRT